jgi:hypothetical protein
VRSWEVVASGLVAAIVRRLKQAVAKCLDEVDVSTEAPSHPEGLRVAGKIAAAAAVARRLEQAVEVVSQLLDEVLASSLWDIFS